MLQVLNSLVSAADKNPALVREWLVYIRDKIDQILADTAE